MLQQIVNAILNSIEAIMLFSFLLGSVTALRQYKNGFKPSLVFLNLFSFFVCTSTIALDLISKSQYEFLISITMLLIAIFITSIVAIGFRKQTQDHFLITFFSFLFSGSLGLFMGLKLFKIVAILIVAIGILNIYWGLKRLFYVEQDSKTLSIQCLSDQAIDYIYNIFNALNIPITNKVIEKSDTILVTLNYKTSSITEHVLLKQLYAHDQIGHVST